MLSKMFGDRLKWTKSIKARKQREADELEKQQKYEHDEQELQRKFELGKLTLENKVNKQGRKKQMRTGLEHSKLSTD